MILERQSQIRGRSERDLESDRPELIGRVESGGVLDRRGDEPCQRGMKLVKEAEHVIYGITGVTG